MRCETSRNGVRAPAFTPTISHYLLAKTAVDLGFFCNLRKPLKLDRRRSEMKEDDVRPGMLVKTNGAVCLKAARDKILSALNNRTPLDPELEKAVVIWLRL